MITGRTYQSFGLYALFSMYSKRASWDIPVVVERACLNGDVGGRLILEYPIVMNEIVSQVYTGRTSS